jgi:hypothetical protein
MILFKKFVLKNSMPVELLERWAALPGGEGRIRREVEKAEEVFLRAFYESKVERK